MRKHEQNKQKNNNNINRKQKNAQNDLNYIYMCTFYTIINNKNKKQFLLKCFKILKKTKKIHLDNFF